MKFFELKVDEKYFNLLWRVLTERENELEFEIEKSEEDTDEAALLGNELVYLRLVRKLLRRRQQKIIFQIVYLLWRMNILICQNYKPALLSKKSYLCSIVLNPEMMF